MREIADLIQEKYPHAIIDRVRKKMGYDILQKWREVFCHKLFQEKGRWKLGMYEWHAWNAGYVTSKRREVAVEWFQQQTDTSYFLFQEMHQRIPLLRVENASVPDVEWCRYQDVIIFPPSYEWTMVFTHEDDAFANGPYFALREWQGGTLYDCLQDV